VLKSDFSTDFSLSTSANIDCFWTKKEWLFPNASFEDIQMLQEKYDVSEVAARLTLHRIQNLQEADVIFSPYLKNHLPDPSLLPDVEKAYAHVYQSLKAGKKFGVWGDYDVDGACSSALLMKYFKMLGFSMTPYVPDRFEEGYGPNIQGMAFLKSQGIQDLFIVDCGTTAFEPLEFAQEQGFQVIVIDHHRVGDFFPKCHSFINPKRFDYQGPEILANLCAGGLVFLFLVGLNRYLRENNFFSEKCPEPDLLMLLDLVALSTICDMMPLRDVNRVFVKQGLKVMRYRKNIGLTALIDASGVKEPPNPMHLSYNVGPRVNAGGRIGDASLGAQLLSCDDLNQSLEISKQLNLLNQERQQIERKVEEEAHIQAQAQSQQPVLFLYSDSWHEGVLGIIASHLKEIYYKTTFVMTLRKGLLKGSVRSIPGFDVGELIHQACEKKLLVTGGGHPMAGGLTLDPVLKEEFLEFVQFFFQNNRTEEVHPPIIVDMPLTFQMLKDPKFFEALEMVGPFGAQYSPPKFLCSRIRLESIIPFGYNHLRMQGFQMDGRRCSLVYFRSADKEVGEWLRSKSTHLVDCVVTIQIDNRFSYPKPYLIIEDLRPSAAQD
jgi:single-stranded-DNA-specific exonuclease